VPYLKTHSILQSCRAVVSSERSFDKGLRNGLWQLPLPQWVIRARDTRDRKSIHVGSTPNSDRTFKALTPVAKANCCHFRTDEARAVFRVAW
jgi:hypothetical protein